VREAGHESAWEEFKKKLLTSPKKMIDIHAVSLYTYIIPLIYFCIKSIWCISSLKRNLMTPLCVGVISGRFLILASIKILIYIYI
jgi:hypothetical protein